MRLLILISLCFVGMVETSRCIHQVSTRTVQPGGSVTILCSYFTNEETDEDVRILWHETKEELCEDVRWIVSLYGNVTKKYKGRLHRERDPIRKRTEYLTITGLNHTDGPRFCCQLHNIISDYSIKIDTLGTRLLFPGEEHVTQLDELIAVSGEEVIIPCYYSKDTSNITNVRWGYADSANGLCTWTDTFDQVYQHPRYFLVNFNQDVSLKIHNINVNDQKHYCCGVYTPDEIITKQRTRLIIADYKSSWDQMTEEVIAYEGHSVVLTCSHSIPNGRYTERNVLRVNVYWRVGNVTGPYAYHPYQEMVHSTYVHRTSITEMTNLIINNVTKADDTSFHCFVVVKLCAGDDRYEDSIEYGGGARLIINDEEHVTQLDELIAVSGEDVIIPCYHSKDTSDIIQVRWGYADRENEPCTWIHTWTQAYQYGRYSLVNFNQDVSLRITEIHERDENIFCCAVHTPGQIITKQYTHLIIAEYQSSWDQVTKEITVQEGHSVVLTCSHTIPNGRYTERNVLRVNVYWRVGNVTGPYAYHPYQEMVHSTYVHRTSITGMTNLMINNVTKADNTSFHCFVVVKFCAGDDEYEDKYEDEYGGGTRLIVNDGKDGNLSFLVIVIAVSSVTVLIILIGVLILLKMKGVICKKKPHFIEQKMVSFQAEGDVRGEELPYCEISTKKPNEVPEDGKVDKKEINGRQMEEVEEGNLLYAKLNMDNLKEKHSVKLPLKNEEVVYAAVVNTTSN